ncbi:mevalonate kinase [Candidatus Bathyarchaeota archaeon]|nr:mevalonate kinase [Candidatus Bathyarchaeota archaeon]
MAKGSFEASAPGKVILLGEHFVVFGKPALVMALDRRARVRVKLLELQADNIKVHSLNIPNASPAELQPIKEAAIKAMEFLGLRKGLEITVNSDIPISAGLGSSAAVSVATIAAVGGLFGVRFTKEDLCRLALEAERLVHKNPSGIDPTIATYGGILLFEKGKPPEPVKLDLDFQLIIGNTGIARSTGEMVAKVGLLQLYYPEIFESLLEGVHRLVLEALEALRASDLEGLGRLFNVNHGLLSAIGVSDISLERLVYAARAAGAFGAKLTGGGGGGCMIALAEAGRLDQVVQAIRKAGGEAFIAAPSERGVMLEA